MSVGTLNIGVGKTCQTDSHHGKGLKTRSQFKELAASSPCAASHTSPSSSEASASPASSCTSCPSSCWASACSSSSSEETG